MRLENSLSEDGHEWLERRSAEAGEAIKAEGTVGTKAWRQRRACRFEKLKKGPEQSRQGKDDRS